jgi:hypothetical protein
MLQVEDQLANGANQVHNIRCSEKINSQAVEKGEIRIGPLIQSAKFDGAVRIT